MGKAENTKTAKTEIIPLSQLVHDPQNARVHGPENARAIRASLSRFGAGRSIVLDGAGIVRAGNGTLDAARAEGIAEVIVVEPGPGQLVAVRRSDWSPTEAAAYAIADNQTPTSATWDETILATTFAALDGPQQAATGFSAEEVSALVATLGASPGPPLGGSPPDPLASAVPTGAWPETKDKDTHQVTVWYKAEDEDAIRVFVGQVEPGPLNPNFTGARILERIKAIATA